MAIAFVSTAPLPARAAQPFGSTACPGVRPGALIESPPGSVYTMGFLFKGIDAKGRSANYVSTVGNYVFPTFGAKTWKAGTGPRALDSLGKRFGSFVYATHTDTPEFTTFGLVLIERNVKTNPQACHFGGPTGVYRRTDSVPFAVQYYGQGVPADSVSPARTGLVSGTANPDSAVAQGVVGIGDEGGPVLVDGAGIGFFDGGIGTVSGGAGFIVSRIDQWITKAQKALNVKLTLQTARPL